MDLNRVLEERRQEWEFLNEEKACVGSLLRLCRKVEDLITVDVEEIAKRHTEDVSRMMLKDVLLLIPLNIPPGSPKEVIHYILSSDVKKMAKIAHSLKDSHLFQVFWKEQAVSLSEAIDPVESDPISLEKAYEILFFPCFERFTQLYGDLKSGEVTLAEVDVIFKDFVDKYKDLAAELQLMCLQVEDPGHWILERVEQIREYHHLHQAVSSAKVILKVKENLGLKGDFRVLQTLLNFVNHFPKFKHEKLTKINRQLISAHRLLQDITEPRRRCLDELALRKEFISWIQETLEGINELKVFVDLASISAGENDIDVDRVACFHDAVQGYSSLLYKLDSSAGFKEFTDQLQELWKALENDQSLPSKLRDSARNLEWLKTVRDSHGSVELSSLSLATAINSRGIYRIHVPDRGQQISPDTVVHLELPSSQGTQEEEVRHYSLEELKELLNKLMLMSGTREHSHAEVESFSEVFCGVQRLVQAFINLYSAGNLLFRSWTATVQCCPAGGSVALDFQVAVLPPLEGPGPVAEQLQEVCQELEAFLESWQDSVAKERARHFYLNYYTAEQLVVLSREFRRQPPSQKALTMLSFLRPDCSPRDVTQAYRALRRAPTTHWERVMELPLDKNSLAAQLRAVLHQALEFPSAFMPSCLDLGALGHCLAHLAETGTPTVERQLPKGLQEGRPNLVACGSSEVLPAALAIYMQSPEQPLPSFDEVLLCRPDTPFEEVALLLRRCLSPQAPGRRLYCLLFADRLGFEVACQAERLLRTLCSRPHRQDYQLVLVCDSEHERGYLPSALSQHKVPVVPQKPLPAVQSYLERHFQVPPETRSAAAVFRDRMCVGVVASKRAGVGKSLYVRRLHENLRAKFQMKNVSLKVIRLIDPQVDESQVLAALLPFLDAHTQNQPMLFHLDVTSSVQCGVEEFLFKLLILQHLVDVHGEMWFRNPHHLYVVEILEGTSVPPKRFAKQSAQIPQFNFLDVFPKVTCRPPKEVMSLEQSRKHRDPGMDMAEFCSETFQRPYQYLRRFFEKENLDEFQYQEDSVEGTPEECIQQLLIHCGVVDPSWAELHNFARFLNYQLRDCENSSFCDLQATGDTLRGFKDFVVSFMVLMARDFATPTLHTSDESPGRQVFTLDGVQEEDLAPFSLRKRWESEPHPYAFFNDDHITMTFIGFHIQPNQRGGVDVVQGSSGKVLKRNVMTEQLHHALQLQRVPFNVNFDQRPRHEKLEKLALALGIQWPMDPDETYELTTDNMLKILAIEMRFRCDIPVIIMGETGCGKTRLIRFLSDLRRGGADAQTLCLVKVHGGTTATMIHARVREAEQLALYNKKAHQLDTILFFDEANTTEAISCIKEVLCDGTVDGEPLVPDSGLRIIAACNPYRKHTQEMIDRLESAGLGYRVRAEETAERLGSIPLRQLVYRVHALPPSLRPLVWDFGQLSDEAERLYIQQIVQRLAASSLGLEHWAVKVITEVLSASQTFMRRKDDECGFVSLRDVERCVKVFQWFYEHSPLLLRQLESYLSKAGEDNPGDFERNPVLWSLVLALGVCYHASLEQKDAYREAIRCFLPEPFNDSRVILEEISLVQDLFLDGVALRKTIAKNLALKENVFMMVVCIELKIPLFLVGKPGSSKSLAKTIVADAMQGPAAHSDLFRSLKQVHLVSFQCSPHSTPQGIISTFRQCARFQQGKDLQQYVSVVVLDEVGLAEDSPKMPLKTLHPLLEDGCIEDDPAPHKKVGFVGISNWALDPAKMNRGIFVSRGAPNKHELIQSAEGICSSEPLVQERVRGYFAPFARAYEEVCERQGKEFFGLRDYYSLIKMVFAAAKASHREPSPRDLAQAVLRNFSGKDDVDALDIFAGHVPEARCPGVSTMQLIRQNMLGDLQKPPGGAPEDTESRYLLVLTRNYVALQILQRELFQEDRQPEIIFGSSFPRDQEYTQICRNINRVKICMETGRTAVLLNLQNLYESLYDALNQYYVYLGGQKYVDLGLGTHRVKCRVHPDFRLVVVEEKDVVYGHFPIPLINRLEKHYLDIHTVLGDWQREVVEALRSWADSFVRVKDLYFQGGHRYSPSDVFMGFHEDACASVVLQVLERRGSGAPTQEPQPQVLEEAQLLLLACATPDAVVRLAGSSLGGFAARAQEYYDRQQHDSFSDFLQAHLRTQHTRQHAVFTEITTFSRLLTNHDADILEAEVKAWAPRPSILPLQKFDTEYSFLKEIRNCLKSTAERKVLIIQTDFEDGLHSAQLVASAKYSAMNEINKEPGDKGCTFVYFITKLSRMGSGTGYVGFHGGLWQSVHIDDLRRSTVMISDVTKLQQVTISQMFQVEQAAIGETAPEPEESMVIEPEAMDSEMKMETGPDPQEEAEMETEGPGTMEEHPELETIPVLDTTQLLRSCIQGAVGLLRDPQGCRQRNVLRVETLLGLLTDEDPDTASFLRVCKLRIHELLRKQEEVSFTIKEWVLRVASNQDALQEAGTFRQTLWKRVQAAVTPLLASIVSFIDRDGNLDLLTRPDLPSWGRELWMFIFNDRKLLNIPLVTNNARELPSIVVPSYMCLQDQVSGDVPFSWRIKDYLEELCVQAQHISDADGLPAKLVEIFEQTPLGRFLAQLSPSEQQDLLRAYVKDFLLLTMRVSSWEELKFLQMGLWSCISELRGGREPERGLSLPWVHLAYQRFSRRLQNFSRIVILQPRVLQRLESLQNHRLVGNAMTVDAFAALACTEMLTMEMLNPSPQAWLHMVKNLSTPLELLCSDGYLHNSRGEVPGLITEVRKHWNRIFSVSLFVEHVLLGTQSQIPKLVQSVRPYVSFLSKCLQENSDMKIQGPFEAVMRILQQCKEQVSLALSRFGIKPCPICLGDAHDPVCLPCDHVFCLQCAKSWLTVDQMICPICRTNLPEDYTLKISLQHKTAIQEHTRFREMCNSFFIDLVSTLCFKDRSPPHKAVVKTLLSLLFVQKNHLTDGAERHREHTKSLSPFDDVVDQSPVIRSVVLKLLLKYSFPEVKDYIQDYLSMLEEKPFIIEDRTELYLLFSHCLEDSLHEKMNAFPESEELRQLQEETRFLKTYLSRCHRGAQEASVKYLQEMARIRLCLDRVSGFLTELQDGQELAEEKRQYLQQVAHFCTHVKNDWFRVYLVRKLCSQHGMEFVQRLCRQGHPAQWVFPEGVLAQQKDCSSQIDRYLVYGDAYKTVREAVGKTVLECQSQTAEAALKACRGSETEREVHFLLALFREITTSYRSQNKNLHPTTEQCEVMNKLIEDSKILSSPEIQAFAKALVSNALPLLETGSSNSILEGTMTEMLVHAAVVLLCGQNNVLEPLKNLAFSPATMLNAFLPTMPEDLLIQAQSWIGLGVQWYTCPNGHPCVVGECGRPMEQSRCVDCGVLIGGINHNPTHGFTTIQNNVDRTQTGHVLGQPPPRDVAVVSDRGLSPVVFLLTRLLTHLALLLGAAFNPQAVGNIIKPRVGNPQAFLKQHLQRDLERLTNILGKSADETANVVHLILRALLRTDSTQDNVQQLSTKQGRNNWEKNVERILLPELQRLDQSLQAVTMLISQDERISSSPVAKIVFGDPEAFLPRLPQNSRVHCSRMWSCRKRITVEHLLHVLEQRNGKDSVPVLWHFLQKESELRLVKFLPEILALQRSLVKHFQNASEAEYKSIRGFINSHQSDGLKQQLQQRITIFLSTWNKLRRSLATNGEIKLPEEYCRVDLDLYSDFELILPRRRGLGLCATALVSYLISLHNGIVHAVETLTQEDNGYSVDTSEVTDLHVISYDVEQDLMPLILSNCQYQVQRGQETLQEFDLEKIQRQLISRFLQGKPSLKLKGLPTLVNRQDWNYEQLFTEIKNKMTQTSLPRAAISTITGQLQSYTDACEALSLIEVTLGFLSTAGGEPDMGLREYVQDKLRMADQTSVVLEALKRCQLKHVIALWQLLSAHKSEQRLRMKKEPFENISSSYKEELSPDNAKLLLAFLNQTSLDTFLLELHELIILKLKTQNYNPEWSLGVTLAETIQTDVLPDIESLFPEKISLSNCISVWKVAAELKRNRHAR